jgi:hypothetical protein
VNSDRAYNALTILFLLAAVIGLGFAGSAELVAGR